MKEQPEKKKKPEEVLKVSQERQLTSSTVGNTISTILAVTTIHHFLLARYKNSSLFSQSSGIFHSRLEFNNSFIKICNLGFNLSYSRSPKKIEKGLKTILFNHRFF